MAKEVSTKTTSTKTAAKSTVTLPVKNVSISGATGKGVVRVPKAAGKKAKDALTVLAEQTKANKAATKARSGAAKRAEPVPAKKVASKAVKPAAKPVRQQAILKGPLTKLSTVKTIEVRTIGQLNAALAEFKMNSTYALDGDVIDVINLRGRTIGHIVRVEKPAKKAAAKK